MTRLLRCSPSSLGLFTDCPRAYWYGHVARPRPERPPQHAYRAVGSAVHLAMSRLWDDPSSSTDVVVAGAWPWDAFTDRGRAERWLAIAQRWVARAWWDMPDPRVQPIAVERTVALRTDTFTLSGRVDRVDERLVDGRPVLVVVDLKAGHRPPATGATRTTLAMPLYVIAAGRTLGRACWRAELQHLPTGKVDAAEFDREALGRHLTRADDVAADIVTATDTLSAGAGVDDVFPARPGPLCGHCDWWAHCPAGQAAGPAANPEAFLDRWEAAA